MEREQDAEAAAAVEVEKTIAKLIGMGAADRDAAIRWLADAEGTGGDLDYLCYSLGLKYGYFGKRFIDAAPSYEEQWEAMEAA